MQTASAMEKRPLPRGGCSLEKERGKFQRFRTECRQQILSWRKIFLRETGFRSNQRHPPKILCSTGLSAALNKIVSSGWGTSLEYLEGEHFRGKKN